MSIDTTVSILVVHDEAASTRATAPSSVHSWVAVPCQAPVMEPVSSTDTSTGEEPVTTVGVRPMSATRAATRSRSSSLAAPPSGRSRRRRTMPAGSRVPSRARSSRAVSGMTAPAGEVTAPVPDMSWATGPWLVLRVEAASGSVPGRDPEVTGYRPAEIMPGLR